MQRSSYAVQSLPRSTFSLTVASERTIINLAHLNTGTTNSCTARRKVQTTYAEIVLRPSLEPSANRTSPSGRLPPPCFGSNKFLTAWSLWLRDFSQLLLKHWYVNRAFNYTLQCYQTYLRLFWSLGSGENYREVTGTSFWFFRINSWGIKIPTLLHLPLCLQL